MYKYIEYTRNEGIATICLDRAEAANSLDHLILGELLHITTELSQDDAVTAVILTANGRFFSAGGDLKAIAKHESRAAYIAELARMAGAIVSNFTQMNPPVIVAVNGVATGAGLAFTLCGDIVLASEEASFCMAYTKIGLVPDAGTTFLLTQIVGLRKAKELAILNPMLSANEAERLGIITKVVPKSQLLDEAKSIAESFTSRSTAAIGVTKRLMLAGCHQTLDAQAAEETRAIALRARSTECVEMLDKFASR